MPNSRGKPATKRPPTPEPEDEDELFEQLCQDHPFLNEYVIRIHISAYEDGQLLGHDEGKGVGLKVCVCTH